MPSHENGNGYRLLRNMVITILTAVLLQIPAYIWYASGLNAEVKYLGSQVEELKVEFRKHTESQNVNEKSAAGDNREIKLKVDENSKAIDKLGAKVDHNTDKINQAIIK